MDKYIEYLKALRESDADFEQDIDGSAVGVAIIIVNNRSTDSDFSYKVNLLFAYSRLSKIFFSLNDSVISKIPAFFIEHELSKIENIYLWSNSIFELVNIYEPPTNYKSILSKLADLSRGFEKFYNSLKGEFCVYSSDQENWFYLNCPERLNHPLVEVKKSSHLKIKAGEYESITSQEAPKGFIAFELLRENNDEFNLLKLIVKHPQKIGRFFIKNFFIPIDLDYNLKDLVIDIETKLLDNVPVNEISELDAGFGLFISDTKPKDAVWE